MDEFFPVETPIDFIKMDIEGAEEKALQGMEGILSKGDVKTMIIEFYPERLQGVGSPPKRLWDRLTAFGFEIYEIRDEGVEEKIDFDQALCVCRKANCINLLCIRK